MLNNGYNTTESEVVCSLWTFDVTVLDSWAYIQSYVYLTALFAITNASPSHP